MSPSRLISRRLKTTVSAVWPLILAGLLAVGAPASASLPRPADDDPAATWEQMWTASFFLESIRVEGLEQSEPELLLAESLLVEGRDYRESELRGAVDRIRRLPFVRDASFSLRRGSERGRYVLVITVEETRRFFFGTDLRGSHFNDALLFDPGRPLGGGDEFGVDDSELLLLAGARVFLGRYGTAFVAVEERKLLAGYTRHRLFGRSASLRVGVERSWSDLCCDSRFYGAAVDPELGRWSLEDPSAVSASVTLPLTSAHALAVELEHRESREGRRTAGADFLTSFDFEDLSEERLSVTWLRDTTDDVVFASRGSRLVATVTLQRLRADLEPNYPFVAVDAPAETLASFDSRSWRARGEVSRWWSFGRRHTMWTSLVAAVGHTTARELPYLVRQPPPGRYDEAEFEVDDFSYDSTEVAVGAGHRIQLLDGLGAGREMFWETTVKLARDEADVVPVGGVLEQIDVGTGLVWRTSWGLFRFGLRYVDVRIGP